MASIFGHTLVAIGIAKTFPSKLTSTKFWILGIICSILPDADVIGFLYDVPYGSFWGHRGFTHSFAFALALAFLITLLFHRSELKSTRLLLFVAYYFLCTSSHALLDAMTTGGLGVAFFSPLDNSRYFFPWRPIKVSPLGASKFFSTWGLQVLKSELIWIGIPVVLWVRSVYLFRKK